MDIKEYISSGIIEAYVMNLASEEEVSILMCVQKNNPEVHQAILDAQLTLEQFTDQNAVAPPPALKANIWAKIASENIVEETSSPQIIPFSKPEEKITPIQHNGFKWFAIAATLLLVSSLALNVFLNNKQSNLNKDLAKLQQQDQEHSLALNKLKDKWVLASNPNVKTIMLMGVEKHPKMKAMVYKNNSEVYLSAENLPKVAENEQYQLWAIVDGKPVNAGVYAQNADDEVQKMLNIDNAQAFAITLEKKGGSEIPTMENMYVMGKI